MLIHFIKVKTTKDTLEVSFDNGKTWNNYAVTENGTHVDDIEFSKVICENINNIIIGSTSKHKPFVSDSMKSYFDLETKDTIYTNINDFETILKSLESNTPETAYSIKIKGITKNNCKILQTAYDNLDKNIYINLESSDFKFCNDTFNNGYFLGEKGQKYLTAITLPDDLSSIGSNTFYGCENLKYISIPPLVTDIGRKAFYNCTSLETVVMLTGVKFIDSNAFDCDAGKSNKIDKISYLGSSTNWKKIDIDSNNEFLLNDENISTLTYTVSIDNLDDFLKEHENSSTNPIPLNIPNLTNTDSLIKLNSAIRNNKAYVDLSDVDFSNFSSRFEFMDDDDSSSLIDTDIKQYIIGLSVPNNVKTIGQYVFSNYENMTTIVFGSSVETIKQGAFTNCYNLAETTIPSNIKTIGYNAFFGCKNIKLSCEYTDNFKTFFTNTGITRDNVYNITIPSTLTKIEDYEFENCTNLTGINIPENVKDIGVGAFKGCTKLRTIKIPSGITSIKESILENCYALRTIKLPSGITTIDKNAFNGCSSLENVIWDGEDDNVASKNLKELNNGAFRGCTSLSKLDLSKTALVTIEGYCFYNCKNLSTIKIPNVTSLGSYCFTGCVSLKSISLPSSITTINDYAFYNAGISSISFPSNLKTLGIGVFKGSRLKDVTFPNGFTGIGEECFMNSTISSINLPSTVKYIDANTFNGCGNLTELVLPDNLEELGYYSFANCTNLGTVKIPDTVTGYKNIVSISPTAFDGLKSIVGISMPSNINVQADGEGSNSTNDTTKIVVYIPRDLEEIQPEEFTDFKDIQILKIPNNIKVIGKNAFNKCTKLTNVFIPKSIEKIDFYAFNSCTNLNTIDFEGTEKEWLDLTKGWYDEVQYFEDGTIVLDENSKPLMKAGEKLYIKEYNDNLFKKDVTVNFNRTELSTSISYKDIKLHDDSTNTFSRKKSYGNLSLLVDDNKKEIQLSKIKNISGLYDLDSTIYSFGEGAFYNCPKISLIITYTDEIDRYFKNSGITTETGLTIFVPKTITSIPNMLFLDHVGLKSIVFEEGINLLSIGNYAFAGCTSLESLVVPNTVTYIGKYAFKNCNGLKSITLNGSTKIIREGTFEGCKNLTTINYPSTLETIETRAFYDCISLEYITFEDALTSIGTDAFKNCGNVKLTCNFNEYYSDGTSDWLEKSMYLNQSGLTTQNVYKLYISENKTSIDDDDFVNESNPLRGLPYQYKNLHTVVLHKNITKIGERAFAECTNLAELVIPDGCKISRIECDAFNGCISLPKIDLEKLTSLTFIGEDAFVCCEALKEVNLPEAATSLASGVFAGCINLKKIHLPEKITKIPDNFFLGDINLIDFNVPSNITSLGEYCFSGCTSIDYFTISNKVTSVGKNAFNGCYNIKIIAHYNNYWNSIVSQGGFTSDQIYQINVDNIKTNIADYTFENYKKLENVYFDKIGTSKITNIGVGAFRGCESLINLTPPESCITIQDWAFAGTKIKEFIFPKNVIRIAGDLFNGNTNLKKVTFNNSPTESCENAFKNCTNLSEISLPDTLKTLGKGMFTNCSSLKTINIPTSISKIEDNCFIGCKSLDNISIGSNVSIIGNGAFSECLSLNSISISSSVVEIDNSCFENCTSLTEVIIPNYVSELGSRAFYGCTNLSKISLPSTLKELRFGTFENCTNLKDFTIPKNVERLEGNVFSGCINLTISIGNNTNFIIKDNGKIIIDADEKTFLLCIDYKSNSIEIPSTITKIGNGALKGCYKLTELKFPSNCMYIDEYACENCTGLQTITLPKKLKRIGTGAFENCKDLGSKSGTGIYYEGTQPEWNRTIISKDGNIAINSPLRLIFQNK